MDTQKSYIDCATYIKTMTTFFGYDPVKNHEDNTRN